MYCSAWARVSFRWCSMTASMESAAECEDESGARLLIRGARPIDVELQSAIAFGTADGIVSDTSEAVRHIRLYVHVVSLIAERAR